MNKTMTIIRHIISALKRIAEILELHIRNDK